MDSGQDTSHAMIRLPFAKVKAQHHVVSDYLQKELVLSIPLPLVVLNEGRQIVFANQHAATFFGKDNPENLLGIRPGEGLYCVHSMQESGCGTPSPCSHCGNVMAILSVKKQDCCAVEARILTKQHGHLNALNLHLDAAQLIIEDSPFTLIYLRDISRDTDREILEQFFLHNALGSLKTITEAATQICGQTNDTQRAAARTMADHSERLVRDMEFLRLYLAAEDGQLTPTMAEEKPHEIVESLHALFLPLATEHNVTLRTEGTESGAMIVTDRDLLQRALENLLKNALDAAKPGEEVTVGHIDQTQSVHFFVRNRQYLPRHVQQQLFQRNFSTKGSGRGIGTYSTRLFVNNYLRGSVAFESSVEEGTIFYIQIPR